MICAWDKVGDGALPSLPLPSLSPLLKCLFALATNLDALGVAFTTDGRADDGADPT